MRDEFEYKYDLLLKEIDLLQSGIQNHDVLVFTIKGWAVTGFSAFAFFAARERTPIYLGIGALTVVLFWGLEAFFKSFQRKFILRSNEIERFLRSDAFSKAIEKRDFGDFTIPDIRAKVSVKQVFWKSSPFRTAIFLHTASMYLVMLLALVVLWAWLFPGINHLK